MMQQLSISITSSDWNQLLAKLFTEDDCENAAALLCGVSAEPREFRLLVRRVVTPAPSDYLERLPYHLEVAPSFYNTVASDCVATGGLSPIVVHSHSFSGAAQYSASDDYGERRLLPVLESIIASSKPASLLVTKTNVSARRLQRGRFEAFNLLRIVGRKSTWISFANERTQPNTGARDNFDRQVRAFGIEGQRQIESLKVGIVGVGGTGSIIAEQLTRAGVQDFILIDPDIVEPSNLNRLIGARTADIGRVKTKVIGKNIRKLGAKNVSGFVESAIRQSVLMQLRDRHLVFSCVDNDRSRALLARFSYQYLIPVIDVGIRLDARVGHVTAAAGRITIVGPDASCLRCSHHVSAERIRAESLPAGERAQLAQEGYLIGIDEPAPAVVTLNCTVAGLAATTGLNMFVNLTGGPPPVDQLYDATTGTVFVSSERHDPGCDICDDAEGVKALGDAQAVSAYE